MDEAIESGFEAIVVTVDAPRGGRRERDLRTRFRIPENLGVPSVQAALGSSRALTIEETFALVNPALSWGDLEKIASECGVPVLVKGILTEEDARLALEHGAAGVVVSNHGGRQLDCAVATADARCPRWSRHSTAAVRSSSTVAFAVAPTSRSRWRSVPMR